jgi:hypothetical protein
MGVILHVAYLPRVLSASMLGLFMPLARLHASVTPSFCVVAYHAIHVLVCLSFSNFLFWGDTVGILFCALLHLIHTSSLRSHFRPWVCSLFIMRLCLLFSRNSPTRPISTIRSALTWQLAPHSDSGPPEITATEASERVPLFNTAGGHISVVFVIASTSTFIQLPLFFYLFSSLLFFARRLLLIMIQMYDRRGGECCLTRLFCCVRILVVCVHNVMGMAVCWGPYSAHNHYP